MSALTILRTPEAPALQEGRVGIIDIGSNSIRLVIYDGPARIPSILFNEKVMAGLGRDLARTGLLDPAAIERAVVALGRFKLLASQIGVSNLRTVATAAVRDAANGREFLVRAADLGLDVELLTGEEEAAMAGHGVLAGIPDADGIVGDLGGGSLELTRVSGHDVHERSSFPFGVLRVAALHEKGRGALDRAIDKALGKTGWRDAPAGLPFYLVGGSWRALARLDMDLTGYPLPILHHYRMPPEQPQRLVRLLAHSDPKRVRDVIGMTASRVPMLPVAAGLLASLVRRLGSSELIVSAYGLREGLLHSSLPQDVRKQDPLVCAAREEGARQGRFPEHGDLLDRWIAPLFGQERPEDRRLRLTACLLADVGWRAHPEFRAERGLDVGLHGNWVGIDARGRAMLARALFTSFGGRGEVAVISQLCTPAERDQADRWGLAVRLAQRLSGGVAEALAASRLALRDGTLQLDLSDGGGMLYGEAVDRRLKALAAAFGARSEVVAG